jgi:hypothetical protein
VDGDAGGIKGYHLPNTAQIKDKTTMYGIPRGKMAGGNNGGFLDRLMKQGKVTPSPSTYNLNVSIIPKSQNIYSLKDKSQRLTEAAEIEKEYKKHKFPAPDQYNVNPSKLSSMRRPIMDPWAKSERIGYLDEI